jgi:hypothetical protein
MMKNWPNDPHLSGSEKKHENDAFLVNDYDLIEEVEYFKGLHLDDDEGWWFGVVCEVGRFYIGCGWAWFDVVCWVGWFCVGCGWGKKLVLYLSKIHKTRVQFSQTFDLACKLLENLKSYLTKIWIIILFI